MKRTLTLTALAVLIFMVPLSVYAGRGIDFEPDRVFVVYWSGGSGGCDSELNITEDGYVYADCDCWDIVEGGARCMGCSTDEATWELCTDYVSESTTTTPSKTSPPSTGIISGR